MFHSALKLKTSALNLLARVKEKLQSNKVLSPAEVAIMRWLNKAQRQAQRRATYARRNAAYPYQSKRQMERNRRKFAKDVDQKAFIYG